MDTRINAEKVRALRNSKAMSQAELAAASALSLRTIQRIESEGVASLESKRSLASVLEVSISHLEGGRSSVSGNTRHHTGLVCGSTSALIGGAIASACIWLNLRAAEISHYEAGIAFGVVATIVGLSCALIGKGYSREDVRHG